MGEYTCSCVKSPGARHTKGLGARIYYEGNCQPVKDGGGHSGDIPVKTYQKSRGTQYGGIVGLRLPKRNFVVRHMGPYRTSFAEEVCRVEGCVYVVGVSIFRLSLANSPFSPWE